MRLVRSALSRSYFLKTVQVWLCLRKSESECTLLGILPEAIDAESWKAMFERAETAAAET